MIKYKPILPSSIIQERAEMDMSFTKKISNNITLRVGVVVDTIEVEDDTNKSKLTVEYNVMTVEDKNTSVYENCMSVDAFGGIADYFQFKRRKTEQREKTRQAGSLKKQNGSMVLLLCLDGDSEQGVILGALPHPDKKDVLTKEKGHHLEGEFNGVNIDINDDGELTITYRSKTDNDGKAADEEAGGTFVKMDKTGSVDINTALEGDDETFIQMNKTEKDINVKAGNNTSITTQADMSVTAKGNVNVKSDAELVAEAGGSAMLKSGGAFTIEAGESLEVKAPGGEFQFDSALKIKATTIDVNAPIVMVGQGGTPALVLATQFLGVDGKGMPVVSQAIGPFSASVFIGS